MTVETGAPAPRLRLVAGGRAEREYEPEPPKSA